MDKLLIIGGSGLVGSVLAQYSKPKYTIHVTINTNKFTLDDIPTSKIDLINDRLSVINLIKNFNPDIVVHTAAHSSVDLCETDPQLADVLHVDVTRDITKSCQEIGAKMIFLSTDAVFDGNKKGKYTEEDIPNPINYYGKTKAAAEKIVLQEPRNVVLRTAVIYGWHKRSRFTNWILSSLCNKKPVDPFIDQYNTPTLVDDLVQAILKIIELKISGLFNATGKTCINRYEFASNLADIFGLEKNLIKPTTSYAKKQEAPRPFRTCLDSSKLEKTLVYDFADIHDGISFIYNKSKSQKPDWF